MRRLLDSSFVIDYLRDDAQAVARLERLFEDGDEPLVNEVVVCEVRAGLTAAAVPAFEALLRPTEFVQPGPDSAMKAGEWRSAARRRSQTLSLADSLIAAAAAASDAVVLTGNVRDFSLTPVRIERY